MSLHWWWQIYLADLSANVFISPWFLKDIWLDIELYAESFLYFCFYLYTYTNFFQRFILFNAKINLGLKIHVCFYVKHKIYVCMYVKNMCKRDIRQGQLGGENYTDKNLLHCSWINIIFEDKRKDSSSLPVTQAELCLVWSFSGGGNGNPLQYSCLENPMDRGAWRVTVHGVTRAGHGLATKLLPPPGPSQGLWVPPAFLKSLFTYHAPF